MIFKAKRDFAKVLFKGEEYEATKVEGNYATFLIDGVKYGFSISDNFEQEKKKETHIPTPFEEALRLLRELADLQNGPPLERYRKEWEDTMINVRTFLDEFEPKQDSSVQENADD